MKVIEFFGEPLSYGGQEAFIFNMYSHFNRLAKYLFITPFHADNIELLEMISNRGDEYIACNYVFESFWRKVSIIKAAKKCIPSDCDVIHIHSGSIFNLMIVAKIAKKKGIKRIIVHSHATGNADVKHGIIKKLSDSYLEKYADCFLACSKEAGKFKFSDKVLASNRFHVINNGIELERYKYCDEYRKKIRDELRLKDEFVLCNVGRYSHEKNQMFILKVFSEYLNLDSSAKLLLVGGEGPSKDELIHEIDRLGIKSKVIMLSKRNDINQILSAVDVFLFPSLFEGLGISAIEAQASGLHTLCSENVPEEANVTPLFHRLSLNDRVSDWVDIIMKLPIVDRVEYGHNKFNPNYIASNCAKELESLYFCNG